MTKQARLAARAVLVLVALALLVPTLVLFFLQPKTRTRTVVQVQGHEPLDLYFLIDASGSVKAEDWQRGLDFVAKTAEVLGGELPAVRVGAGHFDHTFTHDLAFTADLPAFALEVAELRKTRDRGRTHVDLGLQGAVEQLALLPKATAPGCGEAALAAKQLVLLVTDGKPSNAALAQAEARTTKAGGYLLMPILVQADDGRGGLGTEGLLEQLYALSSCCAAADTAFAPATAFSPGAARCMKPPRKVCADGFEVPDGRSATDVCMSRGGSDIDCDFLSHASSYEQLVEMTGKLVQMLTRDMECNSMVESWNVQVDYRGLWCLLLLLPFLFQRVWEQILVLRSGAPPGEDEGIELQEGPEPEEPELEAAEPEPAVLSPVSPAPASPVSPARQLAGYKPPEAGYRNPKRAEKKQRLCYGVHHSKSTAAESQAVAQLAGLSRHADSSAPMEAQRLRLQKKKRNRVDPWAARRKARSLDFASGEDLEDPEDAELAEGRTPTKYQIEPELRQYRLGNVSTLVLTVILLPVVVTMSGLLDFDAHAAAAVTA